MDTQATNGLLGSTAPWFIVVPDQSADIVTRAATELSAVLTQISGRAFPIVPGGAAQGKNEILIGMAGGTSDIVSTQEFERLGRQEFIIRSADHRLHLVGGGDLGTAYAVYTFLESHIGCRWLTSKAISIPTTASPEVGAIDELHRPAFEYREVFYRDSWHRTFAEPNKINGQGGAPAPEMRAELHTGWGTWCHTFAQHISPERYFDSNPEYFALVDGMRIPNGQLCLSNETVFDLVVDDLSRRMAEQPEARYWSVSQNDCIRNCSCEKCAEVDTREGSAMGSMLEFVNRVAEKFPEKIISTLAYQYTRQPPRNIRPAENVHIMLCNIECDRSRPIVDNIEGSSFQNDLVSWAEICKNLFVWDYVIQFSHLVSPFPNLHVLGPNLHLFAEHNVRGIFSQGNREIGGELAELRAFLLAKLSWDLDYDVDLGISDFLRAYYGAAAEPLEKYITTMHDAVRASDAPLRIFGGPAEARSSYLADDLMASYVRHFDTAEEAVRDDPELLSRVEITRLPLLYAQLCIEYGDRAARGLAVDRFENIGGSSGLEKVEEWRRTVADFVHETKERLS
jgi:hypothetical protein